MYTTQRPVPADLHPSKALCVLGEGKGSVSGEAKAKQAHSAVASQTCPHSCTVSRQLLLRQLFRGLPQLFHGLLPLKFRQYPTPRATDRAVAGGGEGGGGVDGGSAGGGGGGGGEGGGGVNGPSWQQPVQSQPKSLDWAHVLIFSYVPHV